MEKVIKRQMTVTATTLTVSPTDNKQKSDQLQLKPLENSSLYQRRAHSKENLLFDMPSQQQYQRYSANYDELPPTLDNVIRTEKTTSTDMWPKYLENINNNINNDRAIESRNSDNVYNVDGVVFRNERKNSADLLRLVCQIYSPHASY